MGKKKVKGGEKKIKKRRKRERERKRENEFHDVKSRIYNVSGFHEFSFSK